MVDNKVYVVTKVQQVEQVEQFTLQSSDGESLEVEVVREDDDLNSVEQEGSELPESDTTTPSGEATVGEEVDE